METLNQDLRFAFRMLAKSPLVTGAAILSLALGIGANTTIFTLINAFFLRGPAGIEAPERVVEVFMSEAGQRFGAYMPFSRLNYEDLRERSQVFTGLADFMFAGGALQTEGGEPEQAFGLLVTGNYFETLGVQAGHGRVFGPADDTTPGAHPVVVLSHAFWQQRFGGETKILNATIRLNDQPFTVIGIAPPSFTGTNLLASPQFWVPMQMHRTFLSGEFLEWFDERRPAITNAIGRLKPEVTLGQADAAVKTVGSALAQEYPVDNKNRNFTVVPLALSTINPNFRPNFVQAGAVLMGVVALVLLIACANVANLLLGRAAAR
ncbi:MAG: hypothetical protein HC897_20240, partial [Thermoanaerobaculia bacterium]|nr:hypothetical protein [Thermoanaerobaculia bacterium]